MTMGPEAAFAIGAMLGAGFVLALRQFYRWLMAEDEIAAAESRRKFQPIIPEPRREGPDGLRIAPNLRGPRY